MARDPLTIYHESKAFLRAVYDSDLPIAGHINRTNWPTLPRTLLAMVCPVICGPDGEHESVLETEHYNRVVGVLKKQHRERRRAVSRLEQAAGGAEHVQAYLQRQEPSHRVVQPLLWN